VILAILTGFVAMTPDRPRDVWVFRSVLDQRARMLTLALHDDLWVAYDATHAGLYKVWKGGVIFDGAVYTTVHGPQPTSKGAAYVQTNPEKLHWSINGNPSEPRFLGYEMRSGQCVVKYSFESGRIQVEETPEYLPHGLTRDFLVRGLGSRKLRLDLTGSYQLTDAVSLNGQPVTRDDVVPPAVELGDGKANLTYKFGELPDNLVTASTLHGPRVAEVAPEPSVEPAAVQEPREPGLAVRTYDVGRGMSQLPTLAGGQTPNKSFIFPNIDFKSYQDFQGPENQFLSHITGFINIQKPGLYKFRLSSDDGAIFWIRDTLVVNHDGLNSGTSSEGTFTLDNGEHPIRVEYFEDGGDELLKLEWQVPGTTKWEVVPPSAFTTIEGDVKVTSPGKKNVINAGGTGRPGDRQPLAGVHPSFSLYTVRPETFRPRVGGIDFLPDGRMVICNWEADGGVYILSGVEGTNPRPRVKRIAQGLAEPLGIKTVGKRIFVLQKQELTELIDKNGDDITDEYRAVANGWGVTANFHEFAFGLAYNKGKFYATLATAINPGGASTHPQNPDRGKVIEIDEKSGNYRFLAKGLRTPNGIGYGYNGNLYVADNQGDWLPSSKILLVKDGAFYGSHSVDPEGTANLKEFPPVVWLPQGEIGNSPSQPAPLNVGPYKNQMIHGDVTHGGVKRVFVETVEGVQQGAVFRFTQGLEAGVNRICWGPDGALYIGGIGAAGNWGQDGKERFGLQKIAYNGKPAFEMLAVRAKTNGMEIELTEPLAKGQGLESDVYEVKSWRYVPTDNYGGPKIDETEHAVTSVTVSPDRKKVFLEVPDLKEGHVVYVRLDPTLTSDAGRDLWSTEAWYTLNRKPKNATITPHPVRMASNTLTAEEVKDGFELLFDGSSLSKWVGYRQTSVPKNWQASQGVLSYRGGGGGDLRTIQPYRDFEFRWDWKVSPGGNSGVIYHSTEAGGAPYETGPEYQLLDNERHADGRNALTSAGAAYAMYATDQNAARAAGRWNSSRLIVKGNHVEHWLNGKKVAEYELGSADWTQRYKASKFAGMPLYGQQPEGFIVLQDHGDAVSFRNLRIRRF